MAVQHTVRVIVQKRVHIPVRVMIHGQHAAFLDDAVVVRQILLRKTRLIVPVGNLFAYEFVHPGRVLGVDAGNNKGHVGFVENRVELERVII